MTILIFLKGLLVLFLMLPISLHLFFGIGGSHSELDQAASEENLLLRIYFIYYPYTVMALSVIYLFGLAIMELGKTTF